VNVRLDRFKRHAQFQKGKLDALGKEKEEASKEIESLTKQIEELRSNAGKRAAGDQSVAARQEALSRQEAVVRQERDELLARQEQAQKESESQLREKETRIQALERSLEKEKQEAKQSRVKRQNDLKQFYDVVKKAAAEKKRFLDELENLKREKAHYQSGPLRKLLSTQQKSMSELQATRQRPMKWKNWQNWQLRQSVKCQAPALLPHPLFPPPQICLLSLKQLLL
jgi:chromosome segregation ATPase